tara:strand:- start:38149 stop:38316 length:168 start_codon:yes stop_codon:yes gene_type:complete
VTIAKTILNGAASAVGYTVGTEVLKAAANAARRARWKYSEYRKRKIADTTRKEKK